MFATAPRPTLVLVFSQQLQDVVVLTWDDITVTEDLVTVRLGGFAIALNDLLIFRGASSWRSPVRTGPPPTRTAAASSEATPLASTSTR